MNHLICYWFKYICVHLCVFTAEQNWQILDKDDVMWWETWHVEKAYYRFTTKRWIIGKCVYCTMHVAFSVAPWEGKRESSQAFDTTYKDAAAGVCCSLFPLVFSLSYHKLAPWEEGNSQGNQHIWVTKTHRIWTLFLFGGRGVGLGEVGAEGEAKSLFLLPVLSGLRAKWLEEGRRVKRRRGGMKSRGREEKQEKADRIYGDCRGAWNRCRIF